MDIRPNQPAPFEEQSPARLAFDGDDKILPILTGEETLNAGNTYYISILVESNGHDDRLKLSDLRITPNLSTRWQRKATISGQQFADYVSAASVLGEKITAAGLLRVTGRGKDKKGKVCRAEAAKPPRGLHAGDPADALADDPAVADEVTQEI